MIRPVRFLLPSLAALAAASALSGAEPVDPGTATRLFPLDAVRVTGGPFAEAADANRDYLLAVDPDRLLAPFLREAGLTPKADSYGNWESSGLDGHTAGHYLSALAMMVASGEDTADGELRKRLDHMLAELGRCQKANGNGYIGGVPGSRQLWEEVAAGKIDSHGFGLNGKWVPWYNVHKTFAGLRDAYEIAGIDKARTMLVGMGDWCLGLIFGLSDRQMQDMLRSEHGGMNEVLADIYAITGERKYLRAARRFDHAAVLGPLQRREDRLTGLHANTQIPKVIGLAWEAILSDDRKAAIGAGFFWDTVTRQRSVAFGGNSVGEHFHPVDDFRKLLESREGPETCNTYNMLRLTELLFRMKPEARYADYYERALYNHILASIHPGDPGYVYFTPIRPRHYRVYSEPEHCFWCCVGSGMENPGKYGEFIYAMADDGIHVNLFIPSEVRVSAGIRLIQETSFPYEEQSRLRLEMKKPSTFTLRIRHPEWVAAGELGLTVNGEAIRVTSRPSSYVELRREWRDGDVIEVGLPMKVRIERLPDGSDWAAILRGPIVLVSPAGTDGLVGLRADGSRMGHVAHGATVPLDQAPLLVATDLEGHLTADPGAGPFHFRLSGVTAPEPPGGIPLEPFFSLHDERYQMYWQLSTPGEVAGLRERQAAEEQLKAAREAATLDRVVAGQQQPEVEHGLRGEEMETGIHEGRHWRHGKWFEYTLSGRDEREVELEVTYWGGDRDRKFAILADGTRIATEQLTAEKPGGFLARRYPVPSNLLEDGRVTIRFEAIENLAGGVFELRLVKSGS